MDISDQLNVTREEVEPFLELAPELVQKRRSQGRIIFDRFIRNLTAIVGAVVLLLLFLFCFLGPTVTGHNSPDTINVSSASATLAGPSVQYPFGTDTVGRDYMARVMAGGQVSLLVGLSSMLVAIIFGWTYAARLVRGEFLSLKEREFVLAARTIGARNFRLMFRHVLPNAAGPIIVNATLLVGANIILESVMSYFGFGIQPPSSSWGNLVSDGQGFFDVDPKLVLIPGLLIFLTVLSFNLVGDGLRDALDPYMTER